MRKHIPNLLTCANLAFGCYACILALDGNYYGSMLAIIVAAGFDFADGFAARLLKAYSTIGKDLDSLADIVSFGVAPGLMVFDFLDHVQKTIHWSHPLTGKVFLLFAFVIPIFSALRLAKFNHDDRQTDSFIGLPVPAHALFWTSLIYVLSLSMEGTAISGMVPQLISIRIPEMPSLFILLFISITAVCSSLLLVSEIPMFSMKIKSPAWKDNQSRYVLMVIAMVLIVGFGFFGITLSILFFVCLSGISKKI
ncbi:MAG: CDP-alcohol phosphatidyltransferase family protein [Tannerella sp.]|jgi:CDP-diacylglycerol--serine O-phosphatidyltransferase|nr:CDP-alcohol phosphatidyltransferase family protein [Tannerella sp.]